MKLFPNIDHKMLRNALLCSYSDIDLAINYILDSNYPNNEQELDAAQGMLHLSTTLQSTLINSTDVIDLSNLPEATADTSTNAASSTAIAMARAFHSNSSVISDTSEEGSVKYISVMMK